MAEDFTLRESIQLAVTTEQLGRRFYEGLARKFDLRPYLRKSGGNQI